MDVPESLDSPVSGAARRRFPLPPSWIVEARDRGHILAFMGYQEEAQRLLRCV